MVEDSPIEALIEFSKILVQCEIPYLVGGSYASGVHGEYRVTNNIDFLCNISNSKIGPLLGSLSKDFLVDEVAMKDAISTGRSFNIFYDPTFTKIDVFTRITPYRREQLLQAIELNLPGRVETIRICSAEDIVISKLAWYKLGNQTSERQWRDIQGVIKVQGSRLNFEYLRRWAQENNILDLLETALAEAGK